MKKPKGRSKVSEIAALLGQRGGRAYAKTHTPEERSEIARLGGLARAKKFLARQQKEPEPVTRMFENLDAAITDRERKQRGQR